jgi:hypothetical protein
VNESSDVLCKVVGSNVTCVVKNFREFHLRFSSMKVDVSPCVCVGRNVVCSQNIVYDPEHRLLNMLSGLRALLLIMQRECLRSIVF